MYNTIFIIMFSVLTFILGAIQIVLSIKMDKKALLFPLAILLIASISAIIYLYPLQWKIYELIMFLAFNMPAFLLFFLHFASKLVLRIRSRADEEENEQ